MIKKIINFRTVLICITILVGVACSEQNKPDLSKIDPGSYDDTWYNRTPQRFMQTNLREIDARDFDVDQYVQSILDASINIVLLSVGGQVANYPTELPFHYKNPYMEGDLVGDVVRELNKHGIRVMARFDFSRLHESISLENKDWLYVSPRGELADDNGHYFACINGDYQQKHRFAILEEALTAYSFDAIFFNAAGYQVRDYSRNYYGICQCENCQERFREATGEELPTVEDRSDPLFRRYDAFRNETESELNQRVIEFVQELDQDLILAVYRADGGIWRTESGHGFSTGQYWTYHAAENKKRVLGSHKDRAPFDTYNHLLGMDYRHTATSPNIGRIFVPQQMLHGGSMGIYFIGHLDNQYDRVFIPYFKELAKFHKTNEVLFTNLESKSRVGLVMGRTRWQSSAEIKGLMKMLTEEHIMFDLIHGAQLAKRDTPRDIMDYELIILGNVTEMNDEFIDVIDSYVKAGGKVLATGFPGTRDEIGNPLNRIRLKSLGVSAEYELFTNPSPSYLNVAENDKDILGNDLFEDFDLVMMNSNFLKTKPEGSAQSITSLIPRIMHGPPEKCYFTEDEITDYPGVIFNTFGDGKAVFLPWMIGEQYNWKGNNVQRTLFLAILDNILNVDRTIVTDSPSLVEMSHMVNRNGAFEWIGMINHTGQITNSFREQVPIYNRKIRFKPQKPVKEIYALRAEKKLSFKQSDGWVEVTVPKLDDFEMVVSIY